MCSSYADISLRSGHNSIFYKWHRRHRYRKRIRPDCFCSCRCRYKGFYHRCRFCTLSYRSCRRSTCNNRRPAGSCSLPHNSTQPRILQGICRRNAFRICRKSSRRSRLHRPDSCLLPKEKYNLRSETVCRSTLTMSFCKGSCILSPRPNRTFCHNRNFYRFHRTFQVPIRRSCLRNRNPDPSQNILLLPNRHRKR